MTDAGQTLMDSLRDLWEIKDDAEVARLERIAERLAVILPPEMLAAEHSLEENAAIEEILEQGGEDPVADWIKEIEETGTAVPRRALLLDALARFSERHGFHHGIAEFALRLTRDESADDLVRAGAMRALARGRPPVLIGEWLKGLGDPEPEVRLGAVTLLAQTKDPIAVRPLASLVAAGDPETVRAAIWAIGTIGVHDPVVESVLVDAVKARFCTAEAVSALGKTGSKAVLKILLQEAGRADALSSMIAAAQLVERHLPFETPEDELKVHAATLRNLLAKHKEPAVRALAGVVLARLGLPVTAEEIEKALEGPTQ